MVHGTSLLCVLVIAAVIMPIITFEDSDEENRKSVMKRFVLPTYIDTYNQGSFYRNQWRFRECPPGFLRIYGECIPCTFNKWGRNCIFDCDCENGSAKELPFRVCDRTNGICFCKAGWRGLKCNETCPSGKYGHKCHELCKCKNNATCNHVNGECDCAPGYQGPLCEEKCPNGTHGYQCLNQCKCQNDAICKNEDGSCECTPGWIGEVCAETCPEGTFGPNCSMICYCENNGTCDAFTGSCNCEEGFYGDNCEVNCVQKEKELEYSQECNCKNSSLIYGGINCLPGYTGTNCQNRDCPVNKWGQGCSKECSCKNGGFCHPATGVCWCDIGWIGDDCSISMNGHSEKQVKQVKEKNGPDTTSVVVPASLIPLVVLLLILAGFLCYKKRYSIRNLKKPNSNSPPYSLHYNELTRDSGR